MAASFAVGWRQVFVSFMTMAGAGMIASTYSIVAVPLAQEFQPSRMVLMLAMTVLSGTCAVLMPFLGMLMDRVSIRLILMTGGILLAAGYAAISLAPTFTWVLVVFGVLIAPANVLLGAIAATVLLSRWFVRRRGTAMGIAIAGISAGGFFFPIIIQSLFNAFEWREALRMLALVLLVWTVPVTLLTVERPSDRGLQPDGAAAPPPEARSELAAPRASAREILSDPAFWVIAATVAIVTAGLKGMVTNLAPLAIDVGIDASDAAFLVSIYAGCSFVAKLNFAAMADKLGPRVLMFASLGGFGLGMAILTQAKLGYGAIALGVGVVGLFGGLMIPTESYLAPRVFGQQAVGRALGLLSGTILFGLLATPPLFGLIFDLTGSYTAIFWAFAALALLSLVWVPRMRLHPREAPAAPPTQAVPAE